MIYILTSTSQVTNDSLPVDIFCHAFVADQQGKQRHAKYESTRHDRGEDVFEVDVIIFNLLRLIPHEVILNGNDPFKDVNVDVL